MLSKDINRRIKNAIEDESTDEFVAATKEQRIASLEGAVNTPDTGILARIAALESTAPAYSDTDPSDYSPATGYIEVDTGISIDFTTTERDAESANDTTITIVDPGEAKEKTEVIVDGNDITVILESDQESTIATLEDVKNAIEEHEGASSLVTVAVTGEKSTLMLAGKSIVLSGAKDATIAGQGKIINTPDKTWVATQNVTQYGSGWVEVGKE